MSMYMKYISHFSTFDLICFLHIRIYVQGSNINHATVDVSVPLEDVIVKLVVSTLADTYTNPGVPPGV